MKGKESNDSNRSNSLFNSGKNMFCFASEKGVLHFNGCNTKYKNFVQRTKLTYFCLGVLVYAA